MFFEGLLKEFTLMSKTVLGNNLVGIYLHGSLAMGCFNPVKSDLDLILVVENDISKDVKIEFLENVVRLNEKAPPKGIELSIVKKEFCNPFVYPTPYELHFSVTYLNWVKEKPIDFIEKICGTDKDIAAHFTIIKKYGVTLYGTLLSDIFGNVSKTDYIDSIWYDIKDAKEDIIGNPMYITLNLCRTLAYLQEEVILSKMAGGEWGLKNLPEEFRRLVNCALECYTTDKTMSIDSGYERQFVLKFADYMIERIKAAY